MVGTIQNREQFLANIAKSLGRGQRTEGVSTPVYQYQPQYRILQDASQDELLQVLKEQCKSIHVDYFETTVNELGSKLEDVVQFYGGGPLSLWSDERFRQFGLQDLIETVWPNQSYDVHIWDPAKGQENIDRCERANVGITFSDITLAESGTVVLFNDENKGRSVSLLPTTYIAIIPKSTIVQRMTQASIKIREKVQKGEILPSCINFITGPSNSADIEMNLVVGVHGPVKAAYIIVKDK
ncbi:lactate utilization protein C [Heyndrickxia oleronia]|uniref:LutC/YkgG family protein n=1 Tax=Heyndrickxia oleronia TaxID=38875 RepID=UPI00203A8264|nr:lactate utilization protein C [Heyndrickxia oleronia]MCM3238645.1 lactate utilization protein C [Heyndrickxia oleronia]